MELYSGPFFEQARTQFNVIADYLEVPDFERDRLLLSAAYHTAMHRKYGDPLEPAKRFGRALGFAELQ